MVGHAVPLRDPQEMGVPVFARNPNVKLPDTVGKCRTITGNVIRLR